MWISQLMSRLTLSLKRKPKKNTAVIESLGRGKQAGQRTERGGGNVPTRRRGSVWNFDFQVEAKKESTSAVKLPCRYLPPPNDHRAFIHLSPVISLVSCAICSLVCFSSHPLFLFSVRWRFSSTCETLFHPPSKTLAFLFLPHKRPCF